MVGLIILANSILGMLDINNPTWVNVVICVAYLMCAVGALCEWLYLVKRVTKLEKQVGDKK